MNKLPVKYRIIIPLLFTIAFAIGGGGYKALYPSGIPEYYRVETVNATLVFGTVGVSLGLLALLLVKNQFRFSLRGLLLATFFAAVSCAAWVMSLQDDTSIPVYCMQLGLHYVSIAVAIGALFGDAWWGFLIGISAYLFCIGLWLFMLNFAVL